MFERLAETIKSRSAGREIIYIPNPGNYGDGLIRYGTKLFFQDFGIAHRELNIGYRGGRLLLSPLLVQQRYFFVYGGGGSWSANFDFGRRTAAFISRFTRDLIVLPTTYQLAPDGVSGTLFRRDEKGSKHAAPDSTFCHDMALYLSVQRVRDFGLLPPKFTRTDAFRTDIESARGTADIPPNNLDFSTLGDHMSPGDEFIRRVCEYAEIATDRLHVAIAAGIGGRTCELHPGNYRKISDIFDASIRDLLPSVRFFQSSDADV